MRVAPLLLCLLVLAIAGQALAATEITMTGDARVYGLFFANRNFTSWNETGTRTEDRFGIWQRLRLRADFSANENLRFRLGLRVNDTPWGSGTLTAANPQAAIEPYLAYLQCTWPGSAMEITAGFQPLAAPSSDAFYDNIVLADDQGGEASAALHLSIPITEHLAVKTAFARLLAANRTYQPTTTQVGDDFDVYQLALPIRTEGVSVTPWGLAGVFGRKADTNGTYDSGLRSGGSYLAPAGYADNQNFLWWTGLTATVKATDRFTVSLDAVYGDAAGAERARNRRHGYFFDAAVTATDLDWAVPGLFGWLASGEDASLANGSERLPVIMPEWGPAANFLFDCDQEYSGNTLSVDPTGTWGLAVALQEISFVEALTSRLSVAWVAGRNSAAGLRKAVVASGGAGNYVSMGRTLADGEWLLGVSFDNTYAINDAVSLHLETGFATPQGLRTSVWGHRMTQAADNAWMASLGLLYTF